MKNAILTDNHNDSNRSDLFLRGKMALSQNFHNLPNSLFLFYKRNRKLEFAKSDKKKKIIKI
jgi:hypothetical protein